MLIPSWVKPPSQSREKRSGKRSNQRRNYLKTSLTRIYRREKRKSRK